MTKTNLCLFLPMCLTILVVASGHAEVTIPDPGSYVVDKANLINIGEEQQLERLLRELEEKTTAQVKVLTVPTTSGEDFFGFVHRHAELWKLGQQGKDNGVLIALGLKERKVRIHTGYGLEGVLPDSWAGSLSRAVASQFFKQGKYSEGLFQMAVATANKVAESSQVMLSGVPKDNIQAYGKKAMQQMMPLMIQGMLNAMHQYYSNPEVAKIEAVHVRNFYEALIEQGFTPEEALQIVVGYGNPVSMGASK